MEKMSMTILTLDSENSDHTGGNRENPRHWPISACCSLDSAVEEVARETELGHTGTGGQAPRGEVA